MSGDSIPWQLALRCPASQAAYDLPGWLPLRQAGSGFHLRERATRPTRVASTGKPGSAKQARSPRPPTSKLVCGISLRRLRASSEVLGSLIPEVGGCNGKPERHSNLMVEHDFLEFESSPGKPGVVSSSELVELHVILADYGTPSGEPELIPNRRTPLADPKTSGGVPTMCRDVQRTPHAVSSKARRPRPQGFSSCEGPSPPTGVLHPVGRPKPS